MASRRRARSAKGRGEVAEISKALDSLSALDGRKEDVIHMKRECFQKLIKYMTSGIDMSSVFVPATKCVALSKNDLPLKKMLYMYLRSAARQNSAVSLLVVQTLLNDSKDVDPKVRGLAVRSMCSLRVPELMENVFPVVQSGLKDSHPYVREVSVMGVLKCYQQDQEHTMALGLVDEVKSMLRNDTDPQVITNCLYVLQELKLLNSTVLTRNLIVSLLNNIRSFSEWGQCLLLSMMLKFYRPGTEAERFDVLEILDFGLNHTNSAVVLASAKLFLHYTSNYKDQYEQVISLVKGPLRTLIAGREPEVVFAALANVQVLALRHPDPFYVMAMDFFYRPEDPSYLKLMKLDILLTLSYSGNGFDTAEEAFQYSRDKDDDVARQAVRTISKIATKAEHVDGILDRLLIFLTHRRSSLVGEAIVAFADALNKFPGAAAICVPSVAKVDLQSLTVPEARAAFVWILGQFGEIEQVTPYILEEIVDGIENERSDVKLEMLTASVKQFCKRPPECLPVLKTVLQKTMGDPNQFIKERANMYFSMLKSYGIDKVRRLIEPDMSSVNQDFIEGSEELQDKLFDEWNTLSVIYGAPAVTFIDEEQYEMSRFESGSFGGDIEEDLGDEGLMATSEANGSLLDLSQDQTTGGTSAPPKAAADETVMDLLMEYTSSTMPSVGLDMMGDEVPSKATEEKQRDAFDLGMLMGENQHEMSAPGITSSRKEMALVNPSSIHLKQEEFQANWEYLSLYASTTTQQIESPESAVASDNFSTFVGHMQQAYLKSVGKPQSGAPSPWNFFFYGKRDGSGTLVLLHIKIRGQEAQIDVRSEDLELTTYVSDLVRTLLMTY